MASLEGLRFVASLHEAAIYLKKPVALFLHLGLTVKPKPQPSI
jgi:hypothetical protein